LKAGRFLPYDFAHDTTIAYRAGYEQLSDALIHFSLSPGIDTAQG